MEINVTNGVIEIAVEAIDMQIKVLQTARDELINAKIVERKSPGIIAEQFKQPEGPAPVAKEPIEPDKTVIPKKEITPTQAPPEKVGYYASQKDVVAVLVIAEEPQSEFHILELLKEHRNIQAKETQLKKIMESGDGKRWEKNAMGRWSLIK